MSVRNLESLFAPASIAVFGGDLHATRQRAGPDGQLQTLGVA